MQFSRDSRAAQEKQFTNYSNKKMLQQMLNRVRKIIHLTNFVKRWAKPCLFLFLFFSHDKYSTNLTINFKSVEGLPGTQTLGGRMIGTDESTEIWQHPH